MTRCRQLFLLLALWLPLAVPAADPYAGVLEKTFSSRPNSSNDIPHSLNLSPAEAKLLDLETALKQATRQMALGPELPPLPPPPIFNRNRLFLTIAVVLGAAVVLGRLAELHNARFNPWALSAAAVARAELKLRTEEEVLAEFVSSFKTAPVVTAATAAAPAKSAPAAPVSPPPAEPVSAPDPEAAKMFRSMASQSFHDLRGLLQKVSATKDETERQAHYQALRTELNSLRTMAILSQFLPIWQMATALEALVNQLSRIAGSTTPSTLRTFAGGVDVMQELCVKGARTDLFTNPPIRLLAVDDDLICRKAVSFSLKKALSEPDLAENGEAALALARRTAYDVIFLDVQMPGMDGYEVCAKIRETLQNADTPVVFVTVCSDFEARAQSILSGGTDLIAKPFLTFEITVKALTFTLRGATSAPHAERRRRPMHK